MFGFLTNDNNDFYLDSRGDMATSSGIGAYTQHLLNLLKVQKYEYPYDLSRGINYLGYLLTDKPNMQAWETEFLDTVNNVSFVKNIVDWGYNIDGNNFLFKLVVDTDLGRIEIKG